MSEDPDLKTALDGQTFITFSRSPEDAAYDPEARILCGEFSRSDVGGGYVVPLDEVPRNFGNEIDGAKEDVGTTISVKLVYLTQRELHELPEFSGW